MVNILASVFDRAISVSTYVRPGGWLKYIIRINVNVYDSRPTSFVVILLFFS